jgi:hypothetical protein
MSRRRLLPRSARQRLRRLRNKLRFAWKRRRLAQSREIRVLLLVGWPNSDLALEKLTPGGNGRFGRVQFAFDHADEPHYTLVLTEIKQEAPKPFPPHRLCYLIGEPPVEINRWIYDRAPTGSRIYSVPLPPEWLGERQWRRFVCPLCTWHVGRSYDQLKSEPLPSDKPHRLSWVTSNLSRLPGHRKRLAFLERLQGAMAFDLFGRGFRPIPDKWEALAPYRYSIAFENSIFDDYFTEKVADPIMAGALPLYYGSGNLERYLPSGAFLRFDPDDPLVLDRIRDWTESDLWLERRSALEEAKALLLDRYNVWRLLADELEADFRLTFGR